MAAPTAERHDGRLHLSGLGDDCVTIIGARGSGKTLLARRLIASWKINKLYIYDPMDEYGALVDVTAYDDLGVVEAYESGARRVRLARSNFADAVDLLEYLREMDNILIVQDEADRILDPCRKCNPEPFLWVNDYGRHAGQGLIAIARRISSLPRDFSAQSILCFKRSLEPRDAKYIRDRAGRDLPPIKTRWDWYAQDLEGNISVIPGAWIVGGK